MDILIIGSNGFIAKNLIYNLKHKKYNLIYYLKKRWNRKFKKKNN